MSRPRRVTVSARVAAALAAGVTLVAAAAPAGEVLPGPVPARVLEVIDGDTVLVRAHIWLGQEVSIRVRLAGVDAPELRSACAEEREAARAARSFLAARLAHGQAQLSDIHYGKFAGRVVARLHDADGADLSAVLVEAGLARAYAGGARTPWCPRQRARR